MNFMHVPRSAAAVRELLLAVWDAAVGLRSLIKLIRCIKALRLQHLIALTRGTKEMAQRLLHT
jgi:hypothetical protein